MELVFYQTRFVVALLWPPISVRPELIGHQTKESAGGTEGGASWDVWNLIQRLLCRPLYDWDRITNVTRARRQNYRADNGRWGGPEGGSGDCGLPPEGGFYNSLHEFTICSQASLPGRRTDVSAGLDICAPPWSVTTRLTMAAVMPKVTSFI